MSSPHRSNGLGVAHPVTGPRMSLRPRDLRPSSSSQGLFWALAAIILLTSAIGVTASPRPHQREAVMVLFEEDAQPRHIERRSVRTDEDKRSSLLVNLVPKSKSPPRSYSRKTSPTSSSSSHLSSSTSSSSSSSSPSSLMKHFRRANSRRSPRHLDICENDDYTQRVCQNCAKITRAAGAIEECCTNRNNAFSWCKRVFDFTNVLGR